MYIRWMNGRLAPAVVFAIMLCGGMSARAEVSARPTKPMAVTHFSQGNAFYKVREFEKAIEEYKAGALIETAAIFDYNLGQCYRQLGKYPDAIWHYERYLRSGVATAEETASISKWIEGMKAELEQRAKSAPPTEPAGMPGREHDKPEEAPESPQRSSKTLPIIVGAGGVALLGGALTFELLGRAGYSDAKAEMMDQSRRDSLYDSANTKHHFAQGLAIAGVACVGVAAWLFFFRHDQSATATAGAQLLVSPNGLAVTGAF